MLFDGFRYVLDDFWAFEPYFAADMSGRHMALSKVIVAARLKVRVRHPCCLAVPLGRLKLLQAGQETV